MKISRRLDCLGTSAKWSLARAARKLPDVKRGADREILASPLVINLLNAWSNFVRAYYISCALGARSSTGAKVSSSLAGHGLSPNDIIGEAIQHFNPRATPGAGGIWNTRDEPSWHDVNRLMSLASHFAFTNEADITAAFTFGFTAHRDLVVFRNYYAHRNQGTRRRAQGMAVSYSIRSNQHPTEVLLDAPIRYPGQQLIDVWLSELEQTVELLCQ